MVTCDKCDMENTEGRQRRTVEGQKVEIAELKNRVSRRNMQIKDVKQAHNSCLVKLVKQGEVIEWYKSHYNQALSFIERKGLESEFNPTR